MGNFTFNVPRQSFTVFQIYLYKPYSRGTSLTRRKVTREESFVIKGKVY